MGSLFVLPAPFPGLNVLRSSAVFNSVSEYRRVIFGDPGHFDAALAVRYLEARPEALLVEPADAVDVMRREAANWTKIGTRVIAVDLKVGEKGRWGLEGIPVSACRTVHSGDREAPMNLMYVFELNGRRVWHEGDTNGKPEVFLAFGTLTPDVVVSGTYSMGSSGRGEATITIGASTLEYAIYAASGRLMVFVPRGTNNECDIGFASRVF